MPEGTSPASGLSVILVHGAFADAASWTSVTERLVSAGVAVRAIVNPLRGLGADAAYVASVINQTPGPVLAVGHSYGGAVIANACTQTDNVVGLVYVAAFAPDEGENELQSAVLGLSQRPIAAGTFAEASGPPAWKHLPTWAAVGMSDTAAGTDIVLSMARRANADITEIDGSHVVMISQPAAVTDVILKALKAVS